MSPSLTLHHSMPSLLSDTFFLPFLHSPSSILPLLHTPFLPSPSLCPLLPLKYFVQFRNFMVPRISKAFSPLFLSLFLPLILPPLLPLLLPYSPPPLLSFLLSFLLSPLSPLFPSLSVPPQVHLVELLWKLWPNMPSYGHKASQFVDLLGYFTINTPELLEKVGILFKQMSVVSPGHV